MNRLRQLIRHELPPRPLRGTGRDKGEQHHGFPCLDFGEILSAKDASQKRNSGNYVSCFQRSFPTTTERLYQLDAGR